jgi:NAD(P)-dependent dehydrogenase (short-subunit alcohol dehydrogenase family)
MPATALVTGASRGIGRAVALELGREGSRVLLAVRNENQAPSLSGTGEAVVERLDVGSAESIDALAERLAKRGETIDVLVNNAGVLRGPAREVWDVNVRGPLRLTKALEPLLADGARVVMVSSGMGRKAAQSRALNERLAAIRSLGEFEELSDDAPGDYGASKAALNRMTELFAAELKPRHILVNAISPGWVRTDMGGRSAPRSIAQGAASILWGCHLGKGGPTGGFFEDGEPVE